MQGAALRWSRRFAFVALAAALLWSLAAFGVTAVRAVLYPWELDYGEGIVWHQARILFTGEAYGDIAGFPAIVFHYTPLFHALSAGLAALGLDGLAAGRLVSLASTAATALFAGLVAHRLARSEGEGPANWIAGSVAGLCVIMVYPVQIWGPLMRVDMLALGLSLGGLWLALKALDRPRLIHAAGLAFVLAVFTKQTAVAAPAAVFGILLFARPRLALAGMATCIALGSLALGVLAWLTDGGFLRHAFLYNVNRFDPERLGWIGEIAGAHALLLAVAGWAFATRLPALRGAWAGWRSGALDSSQLRLAIVAAYLLATTAMLALVAKSGASANYFVEWLVAVAIFAGLAMRDAMTGGAAGPFRRFAAFGLPAALALQVPLLPASPYDYLAGPARQAGLEHLALRIADAGGPVVSDDMVLLIRAGRPVLWEPAIFAELGATGVWDEEPFLAMIRRREFAMFVTAGAPGEERFDERYNADVVAAIEQAYPRRERIAGLTLHLPLR